jgi:Calcium-activated chloride channel
VITRPLTQSATVNTRTTSTQARRPCPTIASNIGSWYTCLEAMGFVATVTNWCAPSLIHYLILHYTVRYEVVASQRQRAQCIDCDELAHTQF